MASSKIEVLQISIGPAILATSLRYRRERLTGPARLHHQGLPGKIESGLSTVLFGKNNLPFPERVVNACEIFGWEVFAVVNASQVPPIIVDRHPFLIVSEHMRHIERRLTLFCGLCKSVFNMMTE